MYAYLLQPCMAEPSFDGVAIRCVLRVLHRPMSNIRPLSRSWPNIVGWLKKITGSLLISQRRLVLML